METFSKAKFHISQNIKSYGRLLKYDNDCTLAKLHPIVLTKE